MKLESTYSLWIWKHAVFTLFRRLKCPLNLSFEQQKVSSELFDEIKYIFWSDNFDMLGIKSFHDRPDSPG